MSMHFHSPLLQANPFALTAEGRTFTVAQWGLPAQVVSLTAYAGRMNALPALQSVEGLEIIRRADGLTGLDLLSLTEGGTHTARLADGTEVELTVEPRTQKRGFASGIHYCLPVDDRNRLQPEPGQRHRKIYVSGSADALTRAAIAAAAGVAESAVTGSWLMERPEYGGSPEMAVAMEIFETLFGTLYGQNKDSRSDWFLFERGYSYDRSQYWGAYLRGEDELHPFVLGAWGEGDRPFFPQGFEWIGLGPRYMMLRDLACPIFNPRHGYGIIMEGCRISGDTESQFRDLYMSSWKDVVLRGIAKTVPGGNPVRTYWDGSSDRISGAYGGSAKNLMIEGTIVDMCGWAKGYDYDRSAAFPMPPSDRNHGLYLTFSCSDLTLRDNLLSQNASCALQIRCGGHYENLLFLDNNIGGAIHSGTNLGPINQFTNFLDSVLFGAAHKKVNGFQGGINWGHDISGYQTSMIGNVVAHRANPDDPAEIAARTNYDRPEWTGGKPYSLAGRMLHNDTRVWEWWNDADGLARNENVEGLDPEVLNGTSIQRYAGQQLGRETATIDEYVDWLEARDSIGTAVRDTVQWAKTRFGDPLPLRHEPARATFLPDPRTEGFRWDNRRNWTGATLPGTHPDDSADLGGNFVRFGTRTLGLAALTFDGGTLDVTSGRLEVGLLEDAADIRIGYCGQFVCGAASHPLKVDAGAGRLCLTGGVADLDLQAHGKAQVLLGPDTTVPEGRSLSLQGGRVMAGWDGAGHGRLTVRGRLEFGAGIVLEIGDALYKQRLVHPGTALLASESGLSAMMSDFEERDRGTKNRLHLYALSALPQTGERLTIGHTEYVADDGDYTTPSTVTVTGILSRSMPCLRRFRSGMIGDGLQQPTATGEVILAPGAQVAITGREFLQPGTHDLTGDGVTVVDQGALLPAGVSVTGGRLVLTIS
ncbi:hypothetical protein Q4511_13645 [Paracoccus sp. 1_MG-2023]|uniref:hypothetical protein n=1 Tax=unclassified Paracoccus (in: a-proteobacteria) TaxID=2688777 RepID=UPI001C083F81|nr:MULTISPECIES: hypothetical protein [unclassified Paracoccus (in: a-proteobacteria)]MBU2958939.1 hypothetical protein [Paracoccus sp. C2R09]MDO6669971.1 hypothetical protein [Paracoccus sp. 1_MG-2023]